MTKAKNTKRALLASVLSMMLCVAMLIGSTFAWFTDSVTSGKNMIVAGNLNVELYVVEGEEETPVTEKTNLFMEDALWEPGHVEVINLKVANLGTLALQYKLGINVADEQEGTNVEGKTFNLSDYIMFALIDGNNTYANREAAIATAEKDAVKLSDLAVDENGVLLPEEDHYVTLVVYMPTTVGNEANYRGDAVPTIDLGVTLVATQTPYENDSFGKDYDEDAVTTYKVTPENINNYLSGEYGSLTNAKLVLAPGDYGQLVIGAPSKYEGGDTTYVCMNGNGHSDTPVTFTDADEFAAHYDGKWHGTPYYTRTIDNLTIVGQEGVTIAGVSISSGHVYGNENNTAYDPVRDVYRDQSTYYMIHKLSNIKFEGISFTDKVNIATSNADTVIDGVTFDSCSFTTGGTASGNGQGLRYYNENNNGSVRNLTVNNCSFNNCYQGIYTSNINGITVSKCEFNTTGHNAIAIQSGAHGAVNHKEVVIENNNFANIGDRIIRFGDVAGDTQITILNNTATNSGDKEGQVIKAVSLAEGIDYTIGGNDWGDNTTVGNDEFADNYPAIDEGNKEDPFA